MADRQTPKYNHKPYPMQRHADDDDGDTFTKIGDFAWKIQDGKRILMLAIPYMNKVGWMHSEWTINHKNASDAQWAWNGDEDKPTLTPSLHAVGVWHGHVKNGELVEA